ncbi:MAG: class I adenylate-forming enzyme family protein [Chthonomonadales bacterium]
MIIPTDSVVESDFQNLESAHSLFNRRRSDPMVQFGNIGELLGHWVGIQPDKNWLTFLDETGVAQQLTYTEFALQVRKTATMLVDNCNVYPGERIAILMTNDPAVVVTYFAAWLIGAVIVPVNIGEDDDRLEFILRNSEAVAAIGLADQLTRCQAVYREGGNLRHLISTDIQVDGLDFFQDAVEESQPIQDLPHVTTDTECLIVYTSGTTGAPKGVSLSQYNLMVDAKSIADWHRFTQGDRAMCILPLHHVNGTIVTLMTPIYSGGSLVLNKRFHAQSFWNNLASQKCTWVSLVPTILAFLCETMPDVLPIDRNVFRHFICGAGPMTVDLARRFDDAFHLRVVHGYGLSETTCYSCFLPIDLTHDLYRHWMLECGFPSIGCPIEANEMAIQDAEGVALPEDVRGEIVIRGHNVMNYYFKRPEVNTDTFKHGWFRSGDEGFFRRGDDGLDYYFITGRLKELIIRGGVNYSPFDIDEVLNTIDGIKAGMAVGFENNFYGEEVGAYVQLETGSRLDADEVIRQCREQLPYIKCPKVVVFGVTFPVTSTGKYQRNKLKPLFEEWKDIQFREARNG